MPMAIEAPLRLHRRRLLALGAAAWAGAPTAAVAGGDEGLLAASAWTDAAGRHHVGLLRIGAGPQRPLASLEVPTRAHGLATLPDGSILAVARRPGDWLLRWHPLQHPPRAGRPAGHWWWAGADRRFAGHLRLTPDARTLFTTEIQLESGTGRVVRRDPVSLDETAVWPTGGLDPHDLFCLPGGELLVANGGILALPETGRLKRDLERMDSSLAHIGSNGELRGQWHLADPRLSIRHLARHASGVFGVALQAEHDDPSARAAAPTFARFDLAHGLLQTSAAAFAGSGYTGDVAATRDGWALSCPRDDRLLRIGADGRSGGTTALGDGCALLAAADGKRVWGFGGPSWRTLDGGHEVAALSAGARFDNHAVAWPGRLGSSARS